ncbi:MAG TPA: OsmC family protein [Chloroflexota bacterium]|jgi:uncharacterized OsmC-like protein|nr:OsmC family protein [Chloroflexota bacterium]
MAEAPIRTYAVHARSSDTFGRVLVSARDQHLIADGPVANGCPGEAITPAELFLGGVATCGVELIQVLARDQNIPLQRVTTSISAEQDPSKRVRDDVSTFTSVRMQLRLSGVSQEQAQDLVERFRRR